MTATPAPAAELPVARRRLLLARRVIPTVRPVVRPKHPLVEVAELVHSACEWVFGVAVLTLALSVLAAVPLGQFLTLGYLLESSGRVARSGRLRDGFVGVRLAARLGGAALGCFLMWLPLYFLSTLAASARVIDPGGRIDRTWAAVLTGLMIVFVFHVGTALLHGGRLRYFFWPFNFVWVIDRAWRGGLWAYARDGVWETVAGLRLPYYFWLGLRGFVGALAWLALPATLLGLGHLNPGVGLLGAALLGLVVLYVPFLQTRFARDNRMRAFLQILDVRRDFGRAPLAFAFALFVLLLAAMPLYLLKIELIPRDLIFLEGLVFLAFMFPARLLMGWAYGRATRRTTPRHWVWRWLGRLALPAVVVAYVFVVFTSQHLGWHGIASLYEQHAFLLPVPFVEWAG